MVRGCVAIWIVAWGCVAEGGQVKVTKCCPRDQVLKLDLMTCEDYVDSDQPNEHAYETVSDVHETTTESTVLSAANSSNLPWWVSDELKFLRASNQSESFEPDAVFFDADGRMPCHENDRDPFAVSKELAVLDDGRLIVFERETSSAGDRPRLTFASTEYCIDRVSLVRTLKTSRVQPDANDDDPDPIGTTDRGHPNATANRPNTTADPTTDDTAATNTTTETAPLKQVSRFVYLLLVCRPCSRTTCVPKCCPQNQVLEYKNNQYTGCQKAESVAEAHSAIRLEATNGTKLTGDDFYFYGLQLPDCDDRGVYLLNESGTGDTMNYSLMPDGRVYVDGGVPISRDEYCVDALNVVLDDSAAAQDGPPSPPPSQPYRHVMLACRLARGDAPLNFRDVLYGAYFVVGAAFLAATLLIYFVLPELRVTVHSGNLIAHTACLFVSYAALAATTLVPRAFNHYACVVAAFIIQFTFLAAFFWLNVMCADIAWTFSGFRLLSYTNTIEHEKKKYIIYSIYAWGCSVAITVLTAMAEFTKLFGDDKYRPNFGHTAGCWFSSKFSVGVFFYLPIGVLLLTNFILFLFTAFRIVSTHADTARVLNRQTNQNNMRLSLYLKLFCLMGVTFVFEVISWAVESPPQYWYVTDALNSLRGVFVFFIFCWKRSVLKQLLDRTPQPARERFLRTFRLGDPNAFPSFSSSGHPKQPTGTSVRTRSTSLSNATHATNSSFQLSNFGSSASMLQSAGRRHSTMRH